MSETFDPAAFVQRQLEAYNAHDADDFAAQYTDDVALYRLPASEPFLQGNKPMRDHYATNRFTLPDLHAKVVNRMVIGNKVIDHEQVTGLPGGPVEVAAIYEVTPAGISKVWFLSGSVTGSS